jgi:hypothetical protein
MKNFYRVCLTYSLFAFVTALNCGCSDSTATTPSSSKDELNQYLEEHPELKDAPEDTVTESGGV